MTDFLIGCDPEVFVTKNGVPISAQGLVDGTKKDPKKVSHGAVQVDGMALEFNTRPINLKQSHTGSLFSQTVDIVLSQMKEMAQLRDPGIEFNIVPVMDFDADYLEAQPDEAKELGCDPDFNAYTGVQNKTPDGKVSFRTAAGHIHIGWDTDIPVEHPDHFEICRGFIKMMDLCVGTYMCIIDPPEASRRRELYGKAGAFRPKSYGVEYRTPSNSWLTTSDRHQTIYALTAMAVYLLQNGITTEKMMLDEADVQEAIDTGDYAACFTLLLIALRYGDYGSTTDLVKTEYDMRVGKAPTKGKKKSLNTAIDFTNVTGRGGAW